MDLDIAYQLAIITVVAFLCQWFSWRIKLPAILPLLLTGLALGPLTGVLEPKELLGDLLLPGVSLAVSIILFEGAMTLRFDEIRGLEKTVRRLVTWGALVTWSIVTLSAWWLLKLPIGLALLLQPLRAEFDSDRQPGRGLKLTDVRATMMTVLRDARVRCCRPGL